MTHPLQATIEELWERRTELSPQSAPTTIAAIESVIGDLDAGKLRVAEKIAGEWFTHQWIKKAVLLSFRVRDNRVQESGDVRFYDKVDTKFQGWTEAQFREGGFRVVPGTIRCGILARSTTTGAPPMSLPSVSVSGECMSW